MLICSLSTHNTYGRFLGEKTHGYKLCSFYLGDILATNFAHHHNCHYLSYINY